jgi:hypothetical protein
VTNQWLNWQRRLAGEKVPIHEGADNVDSGYYRVRRKDKTTGKQYYLPVAFWRDERGLRGVIGNSEINESQVADLWLGAVRYPISEAEFRKVAEMDGSWSDIDDTVHEQTNGRGIGDNSGTVSDLELIREQIESAKAGAEAYAEITDDATLTRAQTLRSRLIELSNEADEKREAEKRPHFEAAKAADARWQPLVKGARAVADTIRAAMAKWETTKLRAQREAMIMATEVVLEPTAKREPPPPLVTKIKGASGKAAHVGVVKVVTGITDDAALYAYFQNHAEVKVLLLKLAQQAVKAGYTVPGVTITEEADVR